MVSPRAVYLRVRASQEPAISKEDEAHGIKDGRLATISVSWEVGISTFSRHLTYEKSMRVLGRSSGTEWYGDLHQKSC